MANEVIISYRPKKILYSCHVVTLHSHKIISLNQSCALFINLSSNKPSRPINEWRCSCFNFKKYGHVLVLAMTKHQYHTTQPTEVCGLCTHKDLQQLVNQR
jgi:hypothetical protein